MIICENSFRVGVWVCECISNPTRKLEWLIKLEIGYKKHALVYVLKEMKNYFEMVYETCSDFSAYCILHVGTLLSFPKLIPLPLLYVGLP